MSMARHHAEWLSLVPVSRPFLSLPVLMGAFPQGLDAPDPEQTRLLRQAYATWQDALEKRQADALSHRSWIRFVLTQTLDLDERVLAEGQIIPQTLQVEVPEHHEWLRPSLVVIDPATKKPRLLVQTYPRSQELTRYVANAPWKASPDTRMTELLHATGVRIGLVTNGEHWMLVDRGETTGYASWYAALWLEEPITLRAFRSLLSASRFFNVPDDQTLETLLAKSASNQQEVTEQLGYQVRRAVEVLIHSLDRADQDFGRALLAGVREEMLYEAALTVMMRLVFLFCAEERELIPSKPFPVYEQNYSVATIGKQLRELADQHGEELLERRYDAWPRLLAAFRAVYGGLSHNDVHIPAYGGNLFNPDRFPFLEGRPLGTAWRDTEANPLPVNNRTVLHLLEALQLLQIRVPGGGPAEARRLSFRALDIEQIGHVYEGLLDHTAKRASEPFLGLVGTRNKEPEIPLAELEKVLAKGEDEFLKFLKEAAGRSENAIRRSLKAEIDDQLSIRFRTACQGDDALWKRVQPFAGLVRLDSFGYPLVIPKGSVFVTAGTDRRSSGTHYTPRSLTEPIVQYTLEPLV
ncbi:MAG: type IIL restriction-modification enzyme MmeI [Pseudomonadota bacterium]